MEMDTLIIVGLGVLLFVVVSVPYLYRIRHVNRMAVSADDDLEKDEPASIHPVVDTDRCINTGNCIQVCPEKDVLGLRFGHAYPVNPARCIGHGLCERVCPVDAIQLVFGTAKRGVEIPRIRDNFETNVRGIYIIGELGGMGLIRNAFTQARECVEGILAERNCDDEVLQSDVLDVVIVGCGPAGLAASLHARQAGLRFETIERDDVGGTVRTYPRKKLVMSEPLDVPGAGRMSEHEVTKEQLIERWDTAIARAGLTIRTGETVIEISEAPAKAFAVKSDRGIYRTRRVILAIGRRGIPGKLNIPGENRRGVFYSLREPDTFQGDRLLVVGGGDSAVEAALMLCDLPDTSVTLCHRGERFSRIKARNQERLEAAATRLDVRMKTTPVSITTDAVTLASGDQRFDVPNNYVFIFIGGELPTALLTRAGIQIDTHFGSVIS